MKLSLLNSEAKISTKLSHNQANLKDKTTFAKYGNKFV